MTDSSVWNIALAVLASLGGGGLLVVILSSWLGKVWAQRLMAQETSKHAKDLESLRAELQDMNNRSSQLFKEKIALYKEAGKPLIDLMTEMQDTGTISKQSEIEFEKSRLSSVALLAMFAPLDVFNSYNEIIDYLFDCFERKKRFDFPTFRMMALAMLSKMRSDVGLYKDELSYKGHR